MKSSANVWEQHFCQLQKLANLNPDRATDQWEFSHSSQIDNWDQNWTK